MTSEQQRNLNEKLQNAAHRGHLEDIKKLVEQGAEIDNTHNAILWTPLHRAAQRGYYELVNYLIEKGANVNAKSNKNETPLHLAAQMDVMESIVSLVENGAYVNAKDNEGRTPLYNAINRENKTQYLMKKGAFIDLKILVDHILSALPVIHEQLQMEDKWASLLLFIVREQPKYTKEDFRQKIKDLFWKTQYMNMPESLTIILNTLI